MKNHRPLHRSRFLRFLMSGGLAAIVNVASRHLLSAVMPFRWAIIVAYLFGMSTAWLLSRLFVFERTRRRWVDEYGRFALINVVAAAQVWLISVGLAEFMFPAVSFNFHPEDVAHVVGVAVPAFTSYLGHKHFTFASDGRKQAR